MRQATAEGGVPGATALCNPRQLAKIGHPPDGVMGSGDLTLCQILTIPRNYRKKSVLVTIHIKLNRVPRKIPIFCGRSTGFSSNNSCNFSEKRNLTVFHGRFLIIFGIPWNILDLIRSGLVRIFLNLFQHPPQHLPQGRGVGQPLAKSEGVVGVERNADDLLALGR